MEPYTLYKYTSYEADEVRISGLFYFSFLFQFQKFVYRNNRKISALLAHISTTTTINHYVALVYNDVISKTE